MKKMIEFYEEAVEQNIEGAMICLSFDHNYERVSRFWDPIIFEAELNLELFLSLPFWQKLLQFYNDKVLK